KQKSDSYYDLLLNRETGSFIYRILAYKTLLANPAHFGIKRKSFAYFSKIPVKIVKVDSSIYNLSAFAKHVKSNIVMIKLFNPWLLENRLLNPDKHTYEIKIPKNDKADYSGYYGDLANDEAGRTDSLPAGLPADSASVRQIFTHIVNGNQTLKEIAEFYGVSEGDILQWNDLKDPTLKAGQKLIIKPEKDPKRGN
ncbi:MAG: LysM peptidoglycan-binding domain-containing protein, partial [Bacteroidia bacterium]